MRLDQWTVGKRLQLDRSNTAHTSYSAHTTDAANASYASYSANATVNAHFKPLLVNANDLSQSELLHGFRNSNANRTVLTI